MSFNDKEQLMRKVILKLFLAAAVIGLAACGQQVDGGKPSAERTESSPSTPPSSTP
jgi:outer membrane lipopolysaccharide assembly protein LptE/RlpB